MFNLSQPALLLLKLELLRRIRTGLLAKIFGRQQFTFKTALTIKFVFALLFVGATWLLPIFMLNEFGLTTDLGQTLAAYHHLIFNSLLAFLFFIGLYTGGMSIYELTLAENDNFLDYPIVMADLVQYRVIDLLSVVLNASIFFFIPIQLLLINALGWSTVWLVAMTIMTTTVFVIVFLLGFNLALFLSRLMPRSGPEKIVINLFLLSGWLFLILAQSFKTGYIGPGNISVWLWVEQLLAEFSVSAMLDNIVSRELGVGLYGLSLIMSAVVLFVMIKKTAQALGQAYHRLHIEANDMTSLPEKEAIKFSFAKLNSRLSFLPLDIRTLLVKDILALVRGPNLLLKVLGLLVMLVVVALWRHSLLANPFLFVLYFSTTFIISRLFIDVVGQERNNILIIKQIYPTARRYLFVRSKITSLISFCLLLPLWVLLVCLTTDITMINALMRLPLLLMTVILTSVLVTSYSAAFAEFTKEHIEKYKFGIHPVAMLLFWGFSGLVSLLFYKIDLALLADKSDSLSIILIVGSGLIIAISMAVFAVLGVRKIQQHA